jgi:predicted DNA-binding WGR domain protein
VFRAVAGRSLTRRYRRQGDHCVIVVGFGEPDRAVFDKVPAERAAREFDRLRRARNQDRYEAKPVGAAATEKAEQVARTLFDAALARGLST